jgi:HEAT repeat protein
MAHEDASPQVRKQAQFWMANKGGKRVTEDLRTIATNDPNEQIRKSAVIALSRLPSGRPLPN